MNLGHIVVAQIPLDEQSLKWGTRRSENVTVFSGNLRDSSSLVSKLLKDKSRGGGGGFFLAKPFKEETSIYKK